MRLQELLFLPSPAQQQQSQSLQHSQAQHQQVQQQQIQRQKLLQQDLRCSSRSQPCNRNSRSSHRHSLSPRARAQNRLPAARQEPWHPLPQWSLWGNTGGHAPMHIKPAGITGWCCSFPLHMQVYLLLCLLGSSARPPICSQLNQAVPGTVWVMLAAVVVTSGSFGKAGIFLHGTS